MTGLTDLTAHSSIYGYVDPNEVWSGTNPDEDWERCRRLMKHFGRDGRKLELWRLWLGFHRNELHAIDISNKAKGKRKQWTEDEELMPSEAAAAANLLLSKDTVTVAPFEYIIPVLEKYVRSLPHDPTNPRTQPNSKGPPDSPPLYLSRIPGSVP
jgi:hypothetical protein